MKPYVIAASSIFALSLGVASVNAEVVQREVTETRTVTGTVSEISPSKQIIVRSTSGSPTTYTIDKKTVFVDEQGNVVSYEQVRGQPVKIYVSEAAAEQPVVVERVVVSKPVAQPKVMQRSETRVETRTED
jgi:hypothetical protein